MIINDNETTPLPADQTTRNVVVCRLVVMVGSWQGDRVKREHSLSVECQKRDQQTVCQKRDQQTGGSQLFVSAEDQLHDVESNRQTLFFMYQTVTC